MKRSRGYYRSQRKRTIQRKKNLLYSIGGHDYWWAWTRGANGRLAKGKIHCSCPMCRSKSCDDPTVRDKRASDKAKVMVSEHLRDQLMPPPGELILRKKDRKMHFILRVSLQLETMML